ncbi:MAG: TRAP transporter large permease [Deltaproteobacteria bacterium]|nr:TRAP transporter large permease [Deltaproteobacteria bacterium]
MSPVALGICGVIALLILFVFGMPIPWSMAVVGVIGCAIIAGPMPALNILANDFVSTFNNETLAVIAMFIVMGTLAFHSGVSSRLFSTTHKLVGHMRGGLAMATVLACAGFAAMCGSTTATAASIGKISLVEMRKYNYNPVLAAGCVASAGTLGIMIPPSTIFIIYGLMASESIGKLFVAGVMPGLLITAVFIGVVYIICRIHPEYGPAGPAYALKDKLLSLGGFTDVIILFTLLIGGLLVGLFGPNAAGGIGCAALIIIGLLRKQLSWGGLKQALKEGLISSTMVLCIIAGATVFGKFITLTMLPQSLVTMLSAYSTHSMVVMIFILIGYLIGGCFMDSLPLIVLTIPLIFPTVKSLGFDPIWFGVMIVLVVEMGVITPPVGVNVFVIKGICMDVPMADIFKGITPFLIGLVFVTIMILYFPIVATWLPSFVTY